MNIYYATIFSFETFIYFSHVTLAGHHYGIFDPIVKIIPHYPPKGFFNNHANLETFWFLRFFLPGHAA